MKTSTKRKAIVKEEVVAPKKRGRPVGSKKEILPSVRANLATRKEKGYDILMAPIVRPFKNAKKVQKSLEEMNTSQKEIMDKIYKVHADNWQKQWDNIEIPSHRELGMHRGNDKMSLPNKITLVLTVVNVAILISLVIKNV